MPTNDNTNTNNSCRNDTLLPDTDTTTSTSSDHDHHRRREHLEPLFVWAVRSGVEFAPAIQLLADNQGDLRVTTTQPQEQGTAIMTIPNKLILSSSSSSSGSNDEDNDDTKRRRRWMEQALHDNKQHLPECLLMVRMLEERSKGESSLWYSWLQSLPLTFSTGLYMDDCERAHLQRMAPQFLEQQDRQWQTCTSTILSFFDQKDGPGIVNNTDFQKYWMLLLQEEDHLQETLKWVFSVVVTRSWRTPDLQDAFIVPLGDMMNHDSQNSNIQPFFLRRNDDDNSASSLQLCLTESITTSGGGDLYLSYGMSEYPARFLVVFGFCDVSAPYVHAHILDNILNEHTLSEWPPIDTTQLVVSTTNGALAEEVWNVFLYKVLQQYDPLQLQRLQRASDDDDDDEMEELLEDLMMEWEWAVALELKAHFQNVLDQIYAPIAVNERHLWKHPRLSMLVNYNIFLRETFVQVLEHVDIVLQQAQEFRRLDDEEAI